MSNRPRASFVACLLAVLGTTLGCGRGPSAESEPVAPVSASPEPSASAPRAGSDEEPPAPSVSLAEVEAVRAWARSAPGHASASVSLVERWGTHLPGWGRGASIHLVARDGDTTLDAWIASPREANAPAYWVVAELVAVARREAVDTLVHGGGRTLWGIEGRTVICGDDAGAPCYAMPTPRRVLAFRCQHHAHDCTLQVETDVGRIEVWSIAAERRGLRRHLVRSWPARPEELTAWWDAGARAENGRWESLTLQAQRGAVVDIPAFADAHAPWVNDAASGLPEDVCTPTVRSVRGDAIVVRTVSCGQPPPISLGGWPSAFVVSRAGGTETTPLFDSALGPPWPERLFPLGALADDALGFVTQRFDTDSPAAAPSGSDDLWVMSPAAGARGPRLHRLEIGSFYAIGYGIEDEREGYVVGIDRARTTFDVLGPGLGRYVDCEHWSGTHARRSDRLVGARRLERVDLRVTFDPERGFEMSDADREIYEERCAVDQ